jgi:hypothetical protein
VSSFHAGEGVASPAWTLAFARALPADIGAGDGIGGGKSAADIDDRPARPARQAARMANEGHPDKYFLSINFPAFWPSGHCLILVVSRALGFFDPSDSRI